MAVTGTSTTQTTETTEQGEAGTSSSRLPRRPYHKPQLRQLGSVRDLTFGSPIAGVNDLMGGRVMVM